jgi:hypothetical protein
MQIQINTGSQTQGSAHWSNDIAKEGGNDKRCQIEVRIAGMQPISVSDQADSHNAALQGAADKMVSLLETTFGKLESR